MNTTPQSAKGNAKTMDIANFLRAAENKTAKKSGPAGNVSFNTLLNEKSQAIGEAAGQAGTLSTEGMQSPKAKQARSTPKDGSAVVQETKLISKSKVKLPDPGLPIGQTLQEKTPPTSTEVMDPQETQETALQEQLLIAAIPMDLSRSGAAATATPAPTAQDNGKGRPVHTAAKATEQTLLEAKPTPGIGSIQTGSAGIIQEDFQDRQGAGAGNPAVALSTNLLQETANESGKNPPRDMKAGSSDSRSWGSALAGQEAGQNSAAETSQASSVLPSPSLTVESATENPAAAVQAPADGNRQASLAESNETERQGFSRGMTLQETQKHALRNQGPSLTAGADQYKGGQGSMATDGMAAKAAPVQTETSSENQNLVQTGEGTPSVEETGRPLTQKARTLPDRQDLGQNRSLDQFAAEMRASGPQSNDLDQAITADTNRGLSRRDESAPASTPKEAFYQAADSMKKADTVKGSKETSRARISLDADDSARPAMISRTVPLKETTTVYAAVAEVEKDRSRAWTSKATAEDKVAMLAEMKPFSENSPIPGKKIPETDGMSGIKAQALIDQIAEARQQMSTDSGRIKITLTPPNLGTVDLDVIVRQNRVDVIMTADQPDVQQLLQARGEDIKSALQRQDMKIDSYQVFLQSSPDGNQPQGGSWTAMQDHTRNRDTSYDGGQDETDDIRAVPEVISTVPHNGIVSIFA